jgi:hypothetical protein
MDGAAARPRPTHRHATPARHLINNSKAAGLVARVLRDALLPAILRMTADGKAQRQAEFHIDCPRDSVAWARGVSWPLARAV